MPLLPVFPGAVGEHMNLEYALRYAAAGLRVHPLYEVDPSTQTCACHLGQGCGEKSRGKHPRLPGWQDKASTDPADIRAWWSRWPRAGIGIATGSGSRAWVLDIDGPEAMAWYDAHVVKHGLTPTLGVRTSRGAHLYWRWTEGAVVRNAQGLKAVGAPNVDVRGDGGYVCAPPTVHRSGHVYTWVTDDGFQREMQQAPSWLLDIVRERPKPKRTFVAPKMALTERELARELRTRLDGDEALRHAVGVQLGGTFRPSSRPYVDDLRCPNCGDREAWFYVDGGPVVCHHRNSCGWAGSLDALRRQA